jgi:hypothetical protein
VFILAYFNDFNCKFKRNKRNKQNKQNYIIWYSKEILPQHLTALTKNLGIDERDVLSSKNVTKVNNVSIKHNTQIFERAFSGWFARKPKAG